MAQVGEDLRPFMRKRSNVHARPPVKPKAEAKPSHAAPPAPKSPAPSAPTPRPQAMGTLPTRDSLRGGASKPAAPKPAPPPEKPQPVASKSAPALVPGGDVEEEKTFWEGSMGPVGVIITALIACAIGYFAFKLFN